MKFYDVFVYGTLRKGGTNHHWLTSSSCIQTQLIINGFCLYDYRYCYPFMLESEQHNKVTGEIYRVDQTTLRQLDVLEDVENKLYKLVFLPKYQCYTYIKYDNNVEGLLKITGGDWLKYIKTRYGL